MVKKFKTSPKEQKAHYTFIHSIIDDIYATIAPEIPRHAYLAMKHKDITPRYSYVKDLWNYHVVLPRQEANKNNQEYVISHAKLWEHISNEPYTITWPIVNALYLSKDTDDATRLAIVTRHAKNFTAMIGYSLFTRDLPAYDVIWNHLGKLDASSLSEIARRPDTPKKILNKFAENRINFLYLASNPQLDDHIIEKLIDSKDGVVWENLLYRGQEFSRSHAERMWFNANKHGGENLARLYVHPELLPINDLVENLDLKDTNSNFSTTFYQEFLNLGAYEAETCQRAYNVLVKENINNEKASFPLNMRVIKILASTGQIDFPQWVEYVNLLEPKNTPRQINSITSNIIERTLDSQGNKEIIDFFAKEYNIDISGYSTDMVRSILNW